MCDACVLIGPLCLFPLSCITCIPRIFHKEKYKQSLQFLRTFQMPFTFHQMTQFLVLSLNHHKEMLSPKRLRLKEGRGLNHELNFIPRCTSYVNLFVSLHGFFFWKYLGNINHSTDYLYGFKWTCNIRKIFNCNK